MPSKLITTTKHNKILVQLHINCCIDYNRNTDETELLVGRHIHQMMHDSLNSMYKRQLGWQYLMYKSWELPVHQFVIMQCQQIKDAALPCPLNKEYRVCKTDEVKIYRHSTKKFWCHSPLTSIHNHKFPIQYGVFKIYACSCCYGQLMVITEQFRLTLCFS